MDKLCPIDLRSDTVTRPDEPMRAAMAAAEVADDVLDGDPTMATLEAETAELLGQQDAIWVPSGCMGNAIALMLHLSRGDRFLAPCGAHVLENELGTSSWLALGAPQALAWHERGRPRPEDIHAFASGEEPYFALRTRLLCLENTHMVAGGTVTSLEEHQRLVAAARKASLSIHLDGARLCNASVALGVSPTELAHDVDSVQICLSKGLGAPVGSVLAGSAAFVEEARRMRKMLGGGVRQGGIMAAAGRHALTRRKELATDHNNAVQLSRGLRTLGWSVNDPETNMVLADVVDISTTLQRLRSVGVLAVPVGARVRFVLHADVSAGDVTEVLRRIRNAL